MTKLTQKLVQSLFTYRNGNLYWKVRSSIRVQIGNKVGTLLKNGYYLTGINGKRYYNHRLIFLYHNGYLPIQIDHIDGNSMNNKIENLRESNQSQNSMNRKSRKNTSSKYKGVTWDKQMQKWRSRIKINSKSKYLGLFKLEIDAAQAYNDAAIKYYAEFAKLNEV